MDYIEAFRSLRTNNKNGRKSPHKAVLMLTVIELFEHKMLSDNKIYYDDTLKSKYIQVWNKVLPNNLLFTSEAYLPFWYLQSDSFWHVVPVRGKEDILSLMRDTNIMPSEAKLNDSVRFAELDDDLYFLMTIASGRSSLKRTLLETYTTLSDEQIDRMAESKDNIVDNSIVALSDYESILSQREDEEKTVSIGLDDGLIRQFQKLNEDLQISLNFEYFSFLKNHRRERSMFKEIFPTVYDLFDKIVNHPLKQGEVSPTLAITYDIFLSDLKISLMSEDGSVDLIDKIGEAIDVLRGNNRDKEKEEPVKETINTERPEERSVHKETVANDIVISAHDIIPERDFARENRKGMPWTKEEEKQIDIYYKQGIDTRTIAAIIGRTEVAIKARLAKLGLIEYSYNQDDSVRQPQGSLPQKKLSQNDFYVKNTLTRACIYNKYGIKVFTTEGKLIFIGGKLYRFNLKNECLTIKSMLYNGEVWTKGDKKIVAYPKTKMYKILDAAIDYEEIVEDIFDIPVFEECRLKVKGEWYNYKGDLLSETTTDKTEIDESPKLTSNQLRIINSPQYAERKQAVLGAMGFFKRPAKIKDIARTISRTAWGSAIKEKDVEEIISTLSEIESIEDKYILRKNR